METLEIMCYTRSCLKDVGDVTQLQVQIRLQLHLHEHIQSIKAKLFGQMSKERPRYNQDWLKNDIKASPGGANDNHSQQSLPDLSPLLSFFNRYALFFEFHLLVYFGHRKPTCFQSPLFSIWRQDLFVWSSAQLKDVFCLGRLFIFDTGN